MIEILLVKPASLDVPTGNDITAARWSGILRQLGSRVRVAEVFEAGRWDLVVALHARKSTVAVARSREEQPECPIVIGLAGTDIEGVDAEVTATLARGDRLIALQPLAGKLVPEHLRERVRVIVQSVAVPDGLPSPRPGSFDVCVLGNLRAVKDPLRAAQAARQLPADSKIRVVHVGSALDDEWREKALEEMRTNPRYEWLGTRSRDEAMAVLAASRLHVLSSRSEGGANVLGEAAALGVPSLVSAIDGSLGLLGSDYPGTFPPGDTKALTQLLERAEDDPEFLDELRLASQPLAREVAPEREVAAWRALLGELLPSIA